MRRFNADGSASIACWYAADRARCGLSRSILGRKVDPALRVFLTPGASGSRSITLSLPRAGSPSNSSRYWPLSVLPAR
jgi:hypothetical protein